MDYDPRNSQGSDNPYPYSDYYSTGGRYRPPKRPRNYGWLAAVLGAFLLCLAGGMALGRELSPKAESAASDSVVVEEQSQPETTAETAAGASSAPSFEAQSQTSDASDALGTGATLQVQQESEDAMTLQNIYKEVIDSVVSITAESSSSTSTGTGIIMSANGYVITNYHVISGAQRITVLLNSGTEYDATRVGGDETSDLAVLKIDATGLKAASFGSSEALEVGDSVVAIGDPLGIELRGTMTTGIICGVSRDIQVKDRTMTLIQTDAALNAGNSGGPLVNMAGQVIGINTMKLSSSYTSVESIGFAIPISTAKPIIDELVEKGYVSGRPAFGFTLETLSPQMQLFYNLPSTLYIRRVDESSDAYHQGIRDGDIITAINGTEVSSTEEFNTVKNQFSAGDTVTLTIYHKGVELDVEVRLMDRADLE